MEKIDIVLQNSNEELSLLDFKSFLDEEILDTLNVYIDHDDNTFVKIVQSKKSSQTIKLGNIIFPYKIFINKDGGYLVLLKYILNDKFNNLIIQAEDLISSKFAERLLKFGYPLQIIDNESIKYLKGVIMSLYNHLKTKTSIQSSQNQLGWDDDKRFYWGDYFIDNDGSLKNASYSDSTVLTYANKYKLKGNEIEFKKAFNNIFSDKIYNVQSMAILLSISSPLLEIGHLPGGTFNLFSDMSGSCKSLSQYISRGFYGDPKDIVTEFSMVGLENTCGRLRNFCLIIDEITKKLQDPKTGPALSTYILNRTMGQTRTVGVQDGGVREKFYFYNSAFTTSNRELKTILSKNEAEQVRMLDIEITERLDDERIQNFVDSYLTVCDNYGHGIKFLQVVTKNYNMIKKAIDEKRNKFLNLFGNDTEHRYQINMFACAVISAEILNKMGFQINIETIENGFINLIPSLKVNKEKAKLTGEFILESFFEDNKKEICFRKKSDFGRSIIDIDDRQPSTFNALMNISDFTLRVSKKTFDNYLKKNSDISKDMTNIIPLFKKDGILFEEKKAILNNVSVTCYIFTVKADFVGGILPQTLRIVRDQDDEDDDAMMQLGK